MKKALLPSLNFCIELLEYVPDLFPEVNMQNMCICICMLSDHIMSTKKEDLSHLDN